MLLQPLWKVEVLGRGKSPEVLRLGFETRSIFIAIGMAGVAGLDIGDGDELFVFTEPEWDDLTANSEPFAGWAILWDSRESGLPPKQATPTRHEISRP